MTIAAPAAARDHQRQPVPLPEGRGV